MIGLAALCAVVVIASLLVPEGEVVTLNVLDIEGREYPTQLWIVELAGVSYLRAGNPNSEWLARLRDRPEVTLGEDQAGEQPTSYLATPIDDDPEQRERIGAAMAEKYGFADWLWSTIADRDRSVPIRLDARPAESSP